MTELNKQEQHDLIKQTLQDIVKVSERITPANVSHHIANIRAMAISTINLINSSAIEKTTPQPNAETISQF